MCQNSFDNLYSQKYSLDGWLKVSIAATAAVGILALLYSVNYPHIVKAFQGFYPPAQKWRQPYLDARVYGYTWFLFVLLGASLIWTSGVFLRWHLNSWFAAGRQFIEGRHRGFLVFLGIIFLTGFSIYFSFSEWERFDRPCWDNYCRYIDLLYRWLFSDGSKAKAELLSFMRSDYHSNSPMAPLLISIFKFIFKSDTMWAYQICCGLATATTYLIVWFLLLPYLKYSQSVNSAAMVLLGSNMVVVRSSFFPQTDAFVLLWTVALLAFSIQRMYKPGRWRGFVCFLLLLSGLFVKLSFLPALALIPILTVLDIFLKKVSGKTNDRLFPAWSKIVSTVLKEGVIFSFIPLACYLILQQILGLSSLYIIELEKMSTTDSYFLFIITTVVHVALFFAILIGIGWRKRQTIDYFLLVWVLLYLISLWASSTSGWMRFYLVIIPSIAVMGTRGLDIIRTKLGPPLMWLFTSLAMCINYSALWLKLYY